MEDKFFDIDEVMVEYAEMTSFDFQSGSFALKQALEPEILSAEKNFSFLDGVKSVFAQMNFKSLLSK